jgi:glycosyltransferase involved in cell wall biosynthesis
MIPGVKKILYLVLCTFVLNAKTICLNMIVKDESHVIERCLSSVKPLIDYWVILDTGSTDGTQEKIRQILKDVPGELHESPWVDFAHNRNVALDLAKDKADFALFMDADEFLVFPNGFTRPNLEKEAYLIPYQNMRRTYTYHRVALIDLHLPWKWVGAIHESIESLISRPKTHEHLTNILNVTGNDGHRSQDPKKPLKDAELIERYLLQDPTNSRYVFYLAQSYLEGQEPLKAMQAYERRTKMGGDAQEVFWSLYQLALLQEYLNHDSQEVIASYLKAHQFRPSRVEPLYSLASYYEKTGHFELAHLYAKQALSIPLSQDLMFVENWMYEYGVLLQWATNAHRLGFMQEAKEAYLNLLVKEQVPLELKEHIKKFLISQWSHL